jgi:hypothetical protein
MTRQTHGLAAKTGLIEALRPAGYEFETGERDSGVATGCAALSVSRHDRESGYRFSGKTMLKPTWSGMTIQRNVIAFE